MNEFSVDLYKEIIKATNGNVIFSPFSVFTAFTMLGIGARGRTKEEMSTGFKWGKFESLVKELKPLYKEISRRTEASGSRLEIANKVWITKHIKILKPYKRLLAHYFHTKIGKKSFSSSPEVARKSMNNWIEQRTNRKVKNLFPVGSVDSMTKLVLGNAIFFKGKWEKPFDIRETKMGKFYLTNGKHINANYMMTEQKFPAYFDEQRGVQLLEIPYAGRTYSMIYVLPEVIKLNEIERTINPRILSGWIRTLTSKHTNWSSKFVYVPKFTLEQNLPLTKLLQALSIRDLFHSSKADLSGINGKKTLYCSTALHKSYIKVDEEGTISSAATGIGITMLSYPMTIRLERPFLFYIIHRKSKMVIFSGRIMNPTTSGITITEDNISLKNKDISEDNLFSTPSKEVKLPITNSALRFVIPVLFIFTPILSIILPRQFC